MKYDNPLTTIIRDGVSQQSIQAFTEVVNNDKIFTISRLGGFDIELALLFFNNPNCFDDESVFKLKLFRANNYPGYFDFTENKKENFISYAQKLVLYHKDIDSATYAGKWFYDCIHEECPKNVETFLDVILKNKTIFNGQFITQALPFLNSFKIWAEGKKILIISPLSQSIEYQYQRKNNIFKNYTFPNFELLTYNTNLTWQHPNDTKEKLGLKTNNWHEECERLTNEVYKLDFDIAFLSCGCYAMPLGYFIKNSMHKKSIYIGGALNILFGIYGGRYKHDFYNNFYNLNSRIDPFENEDVKKITAGRLWENESVNAYFGYQEKEINYDTKPNV
ncbi:MAG: hypothetical protein WC495_07305 [Patescibacteria group bacterium]|jgi:hypothetical protein